MRRSYHIEHHLAPKVPDEHLPEISAEVRLLAARHGLPYRELPLEQGVAELSNPLLDSQLMRSPPHPSSHCAALWRHTLALAEVPRDRWGGGRTLLTLGLAVVGVCSAELLHRSTVLHRRARGSVGHEEGGVALLMKDGGR